MFRIKYAAYAGDVYDVVEVLGIHNLVCGDEVDPSYVHAPYCGRVVDVW